MNESNHSNKPALVIGASGFVGSHTAKLLVEHGRNVRVLLRKSSSKEALETLPVEIVYGDVLDPPSLKEAMQGCGSVFYSVVDPRFFLSDTVPLFRNNVEGLGNALDVALAAGIERFIFTSTIGTLASNPAGSVTENTNFNWLKKAPPYIQSRVEGENKFLSYCREKGLPGVALCIAHTYGPGDYQPTPQGRMLWEMAKGKAKISWEASQPIVDIRDVAEAMLLAEKYGNIGHRYIISNESISNRSLFTLAAAEGGLPPPIVLPYSIAYFSAWIGERILKLLHRKDFFIRADAVFLSNVFGHLDNTKARTELQWRPRPTAETIKDTITWFAQRDKDKGVSSAHIFGHK